MKQILLLIFLVFFGLIGCVPPATSETVNTTSTDSITSQEYNKIYPPTFFDVRGINVSSAAKSSLSTDQWHSVRNGNVVISKGWRAGAGHFHTDETPHNLKHKVFKPDGSILNTNGIFGKVSDTRSSALPSGQYKIEYDVHGIKVVDTINFDGDAFLGFVENAKVENNILSWTPPQEEIFSYSLWLRKTVGGSAQAYFVTSPSFDLQEAINNDSFGIKFNSGDNFHAEIEVVQFLLKESGQNNMSRKYFYNLTMP